MKKEDFEKRKAALWTKWEKAERARFPEPLREKWENDAGLMEGETEIALTDLNGIIEDRLRDFKYIEITSYFSGRSKPIGPNPKKRYQRCFEKRLYLVEFIMERYLSKANRERKSILLRKRIKWKQMCIEWNKAYPNDHMSPEVMKVKYYRAITEEDIQQEYLKRSLIQVPMHLGLELYDYVRIIDPKAGVIRQGPIDYIERHFNGNQWSMKIRFLGDKLAGAKNIPEKHKKEAHHERFYTSKG